MLEVTPGNARQWSRLGSRGVFGQAILAIAENYPQMIVMSADLGNSSGLDRFKKTYPDQFLNIGIAEQNMIGVASGLAKEGYNVFATSFAPFISMRAAEQIRMNLGYMEMNVKAVAIGSGISMAFLGNSHYGIEDAANNNVAHDDDEDDSDNDNGRRGDCANDNDGSDDADGVGGGDDNDNDDDTDGRKMEAMT